MGRRNTGRTRDAESESRLQLESVGVDGFVWSRSRLNLAESDSGPESQDTTQRTKFFPMYFRMHALGAIERFLSRPSMLIVFWLYETDHFVPFPFTRSNAAGVTMTMSSFTDQFSIIPLLES